MIVSTKTFAIAGFVCVFLCENVLGSKHFKQFMRELPDIRTNDIHNGKLTAFNRNCWLNHPANSSTYPTVKQFPCNPRNSVLLAYSIRTSDYIPSPRRRLLSAYVHSHLEDLLFLNKSRRVSRLCDEQSP